MVEIKLLALAGSLALAAHRKIDGMKKKVRTKGAGGWVCPSLLAFDCRFFLSRP